MERYSDLAAASLASRTRERVVTLGFFDGLHRGHAMLLNQLRAWARDCGAEPAVVTFDRHPRSLFGGHPPAPVVSLEHRLLLLERQNIAATLVLEFDHGLAAWSPERFVVDVLHGAMNARRLLMGFDTAFGHRRQGSYEYLCARQGELDLEIRRGEAHYLGGERISSTLVRQAILAWDVDRLESLLGRRYSLLGKVVTGAGRGRTIGFPTANLDITGSSVPPPGVYAAEVIRLGSQPRDSALDPSVPRRFEAVVNIGRRPTFTGAAEAAAGELFNPERDTVEAHLLDFSGDLYGEYLEVVFLAKQRDERRFPSVEALVAQIQADVAARRAWQK